MKLANTEEFKCRNCKALFLRSTKVRGARAQTFIRPKNSVNCSKECSRKCSRDHSRYYIPVSQKSENRKT